MVFPHKGFQDIMIVKQDQVIRTLLTGFQDVMIMKQDQVIRTLLTGFQVVMITKQDQVIRTLLALNMVSQLYSSIVNLCCLHSISKNIFILFIYYYRICNYDFDIIYYDVEK